jgi:hypothetical protein
MVANVRICFVILMATSVLYKAVFVLLGTKKNQEKIECARKSGVWHENQSKVEQRRPHSEVLTMPSNVYCKVLFVEISKFPVCYGLCKRHEAGQARMRSSRTRSMATTEPGTIPPHL